MQVSDGDSLRIDGERIRLWGIDAPELGQKCKRQGVTFNCGITAREVLISLIGEDRVRCGVKAWRDSGYEGGSATTRTLLTHWFDAEHMMPQAFGTVRPFAWYFAQREAVESAIWLYEIENARAPYALMKFDSSGHLSMRMFPEDWTRYALKLATGAGKTKVMSLFMAWSYFHKLYEPGSPLSTNFLLIAPNIIVLDRLRVDFDGARIFYECVHRFKMNGHSNPN